MFRAIKGFILGIVLLLIVQAVIAYVVISRGSVPASADHALPIPFERWAARTSLRATLEAEAPRGPNPVPLNDANLIAGIELFRVHCAMCHGTAQGNSAPAVTGRGEYPSAPQLASDGVEDDPEGWDYWKIKHGIRWTGMPSWDGVLNDMQIWTLALFLKHMNNLPPGPKQAWVQLGQPSAAPPNSAESSSAK